MESKIGKMWYRSKGFLTGIVGIGVAVVGAIATGVTWEGAALAGFSASYAVIRIVTTEKIAWSRRQLEEFNESDHS